MLVSIFGSAQHEYRKVDSSLQQAVRSSTPKPEKRVEIDETRIVVRDDSNNNAQKKIVASPVYYPPGYNHGSAGTLQKKEEGKVI
jgi:hypothetical protein